MEGPDRAACSWRPCPAAASPLPSGAPPPQGQRHRPWARHSPSCFSRTNPLGGRPARSHRCSRCRPGGGAGSQLKVLKSGHFGLSPCFPHAHPAQAALRGQPSCYSPKEAYTPPKETVAHPFPPLQSGSAAWGTSLHPSPSLPFHDIPLVRQQRALQSRGPGEAHFQE